MSLRGVAAAMVLLSAWLPAQRLPFVKTPKTCNVGDSSSGSLEVISGPYDSTAFAVIQELKTVVRKNWVIPQQAELPTLKVACVAIDFAIYPDMTLKHPTISETSGDDDMDSAALEAVLKSSPIPNRPLELPLKSPALKGPITLRFHFSYNPNVSVPLPNGFAESLEAQLAISRKTSTTEIPFLNPVEPPIRTSILPMGGEVPVAINTPVPTYVPANGATPKNGTMLLSARLTKKGSLAHVRVLQSLTADQDAAVSKTIEGWRFEPPMRYGKPIEMAIQIQVSFHLK